MVRRLRALGASRNLSFDNHRRILFYTGKGVLLARAWWIMYCNRTANHRRDVCRETSWLSDFVVHERLDVLGIIICKAFSRGIDCVCNMS